MQLTAPQGLVFLGMRPNNLGVDKSGEGDYDQ